MKIINSNAKIIHQALELEGMYKHIELCGRISYKSEDKVSESSYGKFVGNLIKSGHTSVLEHGTVYMEREVNYSSSDTNEYFDKYEKNPYSEVNYSDGIGYVTTNFRVLVENKWTSDLFYLCNPTEFHKQRVTFKFITSIGIVREFLRHRKFSFTNESTRYCNYSKDKFDNEIVFIAPYWLNDDRQFHHSEAFKNAYELFCSSCEEAERNYMLLLDEGFKPEEAREFLPLCTKSELVMTGFEEDWLHFLNLRLYNKTGKSHPDMMFLASQIEKEYNAAWSNQNIVIIVARKQKIPMILVVFVIDVI